MTLKNYAISFCALLVTVQVNAADKKLGFIDANLDDFIARVIVQEDERNQFKVYYANLAQKIHEAKEQDPKKERATYRYLYNIALENLKSKHADWYEEIAPFVSDPRLTLDEQLEEVRKVIRFFLTRYGAYEEFLNFKAARLQKNDEIETVSAQAKSGAWESFKSYVSSATSKVAGWFGFGAKETATA